MTTIGFIGLGIMGKPMAKNLLRAGFALRVYNRSPGAVRELQQAGAVPCASAREAAEGCDALITMLPNSPEVREVMLGGGGAADGLRPGALYIDMSSISPPAAKEIAAALAARGIRMLDAPVSGGEAGAVAGTLAIMAGGAQADFEEAQPIFQALGKSAVLVGGVGAGNTAKAANQMIVALNIAAVSEALMLAAQAGADPARVFEAIRGGLAGSAVMEAKAPMMLKGDFKPGFKMALHIKDLRNALETAADAGFPAELTTAVLGMFERAGGGGEDHAALIRYYEARVGKPLSGFAAR